jgi:hypothetical protein
MPVVMAGVLACGCGPDVPADGDPGRTRVDERLAEIQRLNLVANDPEEDRATRARAIFTLFGKYLQPGQGPEDIRTVLLRTDWLRTANVIERSLRTGHDLFLNHDDPRFRLYLFPDFPDKKGWSDWCISLSISGVGWDVADCRAFLQGRAEKGKNPKLEEYLMMSIPDNRSEHYTQLGKEVKKLQ